MTPPLRFRQIHLDFHTSEAIPEVGARFDKRSFQETLRAASVNSVTVFATCHHGWSYYDTKVGQRHPNLSFDLLRAQVDACKEIGINVPIYLTAGVHNLAAAEHPEWREIGPDGQLAGWSKSNIEAGFKTLSFHSPYLDYLCAQIREVVQLFPEADGIFLDIINQSDDCSQWTLNYMEAEGLDPMDAEDRKVSRRAALMKYYRATAEAARSVDPEMRLFHNSGHVTTGYREHLPYFSHLELESLPTGGWGYDHFPLSAKYAHKLGMEYLGMTGKFHSTWGEFGGYKHPNALKYECSAMLAYGARCSVGDQLHPSGLIDQSTYRIIGEAYREVELKEAFVVGARNVADIALFSSASCHAEALFCELHEDHHADSGAARVLSEEHLLFDVIDGQMDFAGYKMIILPDEVIVDAPLEAKFRQYLEEGGKLFITGNSAFNSHQGMLFDVGGEVGDASEFWIDYALPSPELCPDFLSSPFVMYRGSRRLLVTDGEGLGDIYDPYFNRRWDHFCSHQHAPAKPDPSGYACGVRNGNILYLAHPVFTIYREFGQVALRQYIGKAIRLLLSGDERLRLKNFPSTARVTLTQQPEEERYVLHLLHAHTVARGGDGFLHGGTKSGRQNAYEIIEELQPTHDVGVELSLGVSVDAVTLEPEGTGVDFKTQDNKVSFILKDIGHHQMIALTYSD